MDLALWISARCHYEAGSDYSLRTYVGVSERDAFSKLFNAAYDEWYRDYGSNEHLSAEDAFVKHFPDDRYYYYMSAGGGRMQILEPNLVDSSNPFDVESWDFTYNCSG
jgi:hypothetical protein